jgi:hypothetical protein
MTVEFSTGPLLKTFLDSCASKKDSDDATIARDDLRVREFLGEEDALGSIVFGVTSVEAVPVAVQRMVNVVGFKVIERDLPRVLRALIVSRPKALSLHLALVNEIEKRVPGGSGMLRGLLDGALEGSALALSGEEWDDVAVVPGATSADAERLRELAMKCATDLEAFRLLVDPDTAKSLEIPVDALPSPSVFPGGMSALKGEPTAARCLAIAAGAGNRESFRFLVGFCSATPDVNVMVEAMCGGDRDLIRDCWNALSEGAKRDGLVAKVFCCERICLKTDFSDLVPHDPVQSPDSPALSLLNDDAAFANDTRPSRFALSLRAFQQSRTSS